MALVVPAFRPGLLIETRGIAFERAGTRRVWSWSTGTDVRLLCLVWLGNMVRPYEDLTSDITSSSRRARRKGKATERWRRKARGSTAGLPSQDSQLPKRDGNHRANGPSGPWKGWPSQPPRALRYCQSAYSRGEAPWHQPPGQVCFAPTTPSTSGSMASADRVDPGAIASPARKRPGRGRTRPRHADRRCPVTHRAIDRPLGGRDTRLGYECHPHHRDRRCRPDNAHLAQRRAGPALRRDPWSEP